MVSVTFVTIANSTVSYGQFTASNNHSGIQILTSRKAFKLLICEKFCLLLDLGFLGRMYSCWNQARPRPISVWKPDDDDGSSETEINKELKNFIFQLWLWLQHFSSETETEMINKIKFLS